MQRVVQLTWKQPWKWYRGRLDFEIQNMIFIQTGKYVMNINLLFQVENILDSFVALKLYSLHKHKIDFEYKRSSVITTTPLLNKRIS